MSDSKTNLWEETLQILTENNKTPDTVVQVICVGAAYTIGEFELLAKNIIYDAGYGGNEIDMNLKVVGKDYWLERGEYDGSEWWEFKSLPIVEEQFRPMTKEDILNSY